MSRGSSSVGISPNPLRRIGVACLRAVTATRSADSALSSSDATLTTPTIPLPKTSESPQLLRIRHSMSHVLAMAVQKLFHKAQVTIGPWTENGFYYDFFRNEPFTTEDFAAIEKKMREIIQRDLTVMHELARLARNNSAEARRLRIDEIVDEYEKTILDELDLMREAANASQLRRNFAGSDLLHVPEVYWDHCRVDVMVMERIRGVTISDMDTLRAVGANIPLLAESGVKIFFTQVFRHNFFHADMHPGNIFVLIDNPARPRYAAVDFGIVGTLDLRDQHYLAENFLAVFDRNYRRVAELHVESGWVPPDTRVDEMESAIRTVLEPIFNKPLKDISFGTILLRLFDISRRFDMRIQPQLILLQKTLLNIEGLGRDLHPELDIWQTAAPILREWMRDRLSPRAQLRQFRDHLPALVEVAQALPPLMKVAVQRLQDGTLHIGAQPEDIERLREEIRASERRRSKTAIASMLGLGGLLWLGLGLDPPWLTTVLIIASAVFYWRSRRH